MMVLKMMMASMMLVMMIVVTMMMMTMVTKVIMDDKRLYIVLLTPYSNQSLELSVLVNFESQPSFRSVAQMHNQALGYASTAVDIDVDIDIGDVD